MGSTSVYPHDHGRLPRNDEAMLIARALVEEHINRWGMVPMPDTLKEAIAKALTDAARVTMERCRDAAHEAIRRA